MELKQIKELMAAMVRTGIKKLSVKQKDFELQLERENETQGRSSEISRDDEEAFYHGDYKPSKRDLAFTKGGGSLIYPSSGKSSEVIEEKISEDTSIQFIKSPMVGTFYQSPSADDPPFIKVGDIVSEDTVVCIIEAMKVMNEIKAGISGTVKEVMVENSYPVEFGSPLFKIT